MQFSRPIKPALESLICRQYYCRVFSCLYTVNYKTPYSHSIVNEPFFLFNIDGLFVMACGNTIKNAIFNQT